MRLVLVDQSRFNQRFQVKLDDGAAVEAVVYRGDSLCVSSQVGCAVGCPFCASGSRGLARPLTFEELRRQVELARVHAPGLRRVTVSGVGEPLHNPRAVAGLLGWCRAQGLAMSLTTSGGRPALLREWLGMPHNGLTVSVHAGSEPVRARLVPRGPSLGALAEVLASALPSLSRRRRKKLALAYLLLAGENDSSDEVDAFVCWAAPLGLAVHLYDYNPNAFSSQRGAARERYEQVYARMRAAGLVVRMSSQARLERNGGCGTLVALARGR